MARSPRDGPGDGGGRSDPARISLAVRKREETPRSAIMDVGPVHTSPRLFFDDVASQSRVYFLMMSGQRSCVSSRCQAGSVVSVR